MVKPIDVDDSTFDQVVLKAKLPTLVDFWAPWCGPCLAVSPIVDDLAQEYNGRMSFARMNVDQSPRTSAKYSIRGIPTLLLFKEGKPMGQVVGFRPKGDLKQVIDELIEQ